MACVGGANGLNTLLCNFSLHWLGKAGPFSFSSSSSSFSSFSFISSSPFFLLLFLYLYLFFLFSSFFLLSPFLPLPPPGSPPHGALSPPQRLPLALVLPISPPPFLEGPSNTSYAFMWGRAPTPSSIVSQLLQTDGDVRRTLQPVSYMSALELLSSMCQLCGNIASLPGAPPLPALIPIWVLQSGLLPLSTLCT